MNKNLSKYNCEEYLNNYYSNGMFHPSEAYDLFGHKEIIEDEENQHLQIGGIWDDVDSKICYREFKKGVWGRYNNSGKYYLLSETLKELVEGWYPYNSKYWGSMESRIQWSKIAIFYQTNIEKYNWNSTELMEFVIEAIENRILQKYFIKAHGNSFNISSVNGFVGRPKSNMVVVNYNIEKEEYCVHYQESFFKENSSKAFNRYESKAAMYSIKEWIEKSNRV